MAALLVYPGGRHRRPVLERIASYLRERRIEFIICVASSEALEYAKSWADDLADAWLCAANADELVAALGERELSACLSYDEFGVETAAATAERLGLRGPPSEVVRAVQDKASFREHCNALGCARAAATHRLRSSRDLAAVDGAWPKVLKPARGGGSYFVRKVASPSDLAEAYAELAPQLAASKLPQLAKAGGFVVEEYVGGDEFDLDGVVLDGRFVFACLSDNDPAAEPHFLEQGGRYPSSLPPETAKRIHEVADAVVAAWPQLSGVVHFEGKVAGGEVFPLEMNLRLGGAEAPSCVLAATGVDLAPLVPALALGDATAPLLEARAAPRHARSVNVQLDAGCQRVTACGPRPGLDDEPGFVGAQFYYQAGEAYQGSGSQLTLAWVAAAGANPEEADQRLKACLELCEFAGSAE